MGRYGNKMMIHVKIKLWHVYTANERSARANGLSHYDGLFGGNSVARDKRRL